MADQQGCILVIEVKVNDEIYVLAWKYYSSMVLANIYNLNTELEQLFSLSQLSRFSENIHNINSKKIVLGRDFLS